MTGSWRLRTMLAAALVLAAGFSGGALAVPAHQIRIGRFRVSPDVAVLGTTQPLTITGFATAYPGGTGQEPWQEFPSAVFDIMGRLHVAWEARDATRIASGKPSPAVAHFVRTGPATWSASGNQSTPPYLGFGGDFPEQRRPVLVSDTSGGVHVLASGLGGADCVALQLGVLQG